MFVEAFSSAHLNEIIFLFGTGPHNSSTALRASNRATALGRSTGIALQLPTYHSQHGVSAE